MPDNQTREEWLELPTVADNPEALGTGVVLFRPGSGKEYLREVTYDEMLTRDRDNDFYAFAWVPHAVATYTQLREEPCGGRCAKTCKRPGCLCDHSIGRCR